MDNLILPAFSILGVIAGAFFVTQNVRWAGLLYSTAAKYDGDFLGAPRRRLLWALPFVALLHPMPYVICAVVFATFRCLEGTLESVWSWFFAGFYGYLVLMGCMVLSLLHRRRPRPQDVSVP